MNERIMSMVCHPDNYAALAEVHPRIVWACDRDAPRNRAYSFHQPGAFDFEMISMNIAVAFG